MSKLFACLITEPGRRNELVPVARRFAYSIELLEDGVVFDVSGLEKLIGNEQELAKAIRNEMTESGAAGNLALGTSLSGVILNARHGTKDVTENPAATFGRLPLRHLGVENDRTNVLSMLGLQRIEELKTIPGEDLIARYGQEFQKVIDLANLADQRFLVPNIDDASTVWKYDLDHPVTDSEQLILLLSHGLEIVAEAVERIAMSTEQIDILLGLGPGSEKSYEIRTSFPTLDRRFWLKLIYLRLSVDPPENEITSVRITSHFVPPRPVQSGLFASAKPTPENLLLTVNKIKKTIGCDRVGVPAVLEQRLAEPFEIADKVPCGLEEPATEIIMPAIAFRYFRPPVPAQVLVRQKQLVFLKTVRFQGRVEQYSGVWKANSRWWSQETWRTVEWDVELENSVVYRLCKRGTDWFVVGEYD